MPENEAWSVTFEQTGRHPTQTENTYSIILMNILAAILPIVKTHTDEQTGRHPTQRENTYIIILMNKQIGRHRTRRENI